MLLLLHGHVGGGEKQLIGFTDLIGFTEQHRSQDSQNRYHHGAKQN